MKKEMDLKSLQGTWMNNLDSEDEAIILIEDYIVMRIIGEHGRIEHTMDWSEELNAWSFMEGMFKSTYWFTINSATNITLFHKSELEKEPVGFDLVKSK